jgi:hypothetical protein
MFKSTYGLWWHMSSTQEPGLYGETLYQKMKPTRMQIICTCSTSNYIKIFKHEEGKTDQFGYNDRIVGSFFLFIFS